MSIAARAQPLAVSSLSLVPKQFHTKCWSALLAPHVSGAHITVGVPLLNVTLIPGVVLFGKCVGIDNILLGILFPPSS